MEVGDSTTAPRHLLYMHVLGLFHLRSRGDGMETKIKYGKGGYAKTIEVSMISIGLFNTRDVCNKHEEFWNGI